MIEKKHGDVFSKHSEIWNRIKEFIGKDSDFGVIQNDKFISAKIKSQKDEIKTDFLDVDYHQ